VGKRGALNRLVSDQFRASAALDPTTADVDRPLAGAYTRSLFSST
jgi:hypothetical protein